MQLSYELSQKDFYESLIAHRNRMQLAKWSIRVIVAILLLAASGGVLAIILKPDSKTVSNFAPLFFLMIFWAILLWIGPWLSARKQYQQQPSAKGVRTMDAEAAGVHWTWQGGETFIKWPMFVRWLETKTQFMVYTSPVAFHMVPKRVLSPEQTDEFRSLLRQNICTKK